MAARSINVFLITVIILCANGLYQMTGLGSLAKAANLGGVILIGALILLHAVYGAIRSGTRKIFTSPIILILLSVFTSTITAYFVRDQAFGPSFMAIFPMFYYFLYFLLHQMDFDPKDLEKVLFSFGILYVGLHFLQYFLYPKILFDGAILEDRGTIRIYLGGSHYLVITYYLSLQRFLRSRRFKYMLVVFIILLVMVMRGGRQPLAIFLFVTALFVMIDRQVKSRAFLIFLGLVMAGSIYLMFQNVFMELFSTTQQNLSAGEEYIRFRAMKYYLTDFYESGVAYLTGNGNFNPHTDYGKLITLNTLKYQFYLGDIGLAGNYVIYGAFFVIGVLMICIKAFANKVTSDSIYLKYIFLSITISLIAGGGFASATFICYVVCIMYLLDRSSAAATEDPNSLIKQGGQIVPESQTK